MKSTSILTMVELVRSRNGSSWYGVLWLAIIVLWSAWSHCGDVVMRRFNKPECGRTILQPLQVMHSFRTVSNAVNRSTAMCPIGTVSYFLFSVITSHKSSKTTPTQLLITFYKKLALVTSAMNWKADFQSAISTFHWIVLQVVNCLEENVRSWCLPTWLFGEIWCPTLRRNRAQ